VLQRPLKERCRRVGVPESPTRSSKPEWRAVRLVDARPTGAVPRSAAAVGRPVKLGIVEATGTGLATCRQGAAFELAPAGGQAMRRTPVAAAGGATTTAKPVAATEATVVGRPAVAVTGEAAGRTTATPAVVTAAAVASRPAVLVMREAAERTMRLLLGPTAAVVADRPAVLRVHEEKAGGTKKSTDRAPTAEALAHRLFALLTDEAAAIGKTWGATPQVATAVAVGDRRVVLTTAASATAGTTL